MRVDLDPIDLSSALRNIESAPIGVVEEDAPRPQLGGTSALALGGRIVDPQVRAAATRPVASPDALAVTRPVPSAGALAETPLSSDAIAKPLPADLAVTRPVQIEVDTPDGEASEARTAVPNPIGATPRSADLETSLREDEPRPPASRRWLPVVAGLAVAAAVAGLWVARDPSTEGERIDAAASPMTASNAGVVPPPKLASPRTESIPAATLGAAKHGSAAEPHVAEPEAPLAASAPSKPQANPSAATSARSAGVVADAPAADAEVAAEGPAADAEIPGGVVVDAAPAVDAAPTDEVDADEDALDSAGAEVSPALRAAYDDAVRVFEETHSQEALARVASSACTMNDHPAAYAAFRKLVGKELRSQVVIRCRDVGIDVTVAAHRRSPEELVAMAEDALGRGETLRAYKMARVSNRRQRSPEAIVMMGRAACALGNPTEARALLRHLQPEERTALTEQCKAAGIDL